jgi:4-alpha-glucanotransferase
LTTEIYARLDNRRGGAWFLLVEPDARGRVALKEHAHRNAALHPVIGLLMSDLEQWREQAAAWAVEPGYFDVEGRRRDADAETLRRVIEALSASGVAPAAVDQHIEPQTAYQGDGRRVWVLAVQLYAVRSRRNWGHGDFTDLAVLLERVADLGGAGIGLNPLHALHYDRSAIGSPYAPNSRLFLNPLYIDVEAVEEFAGADAFEAEIEELRRTDLVDYLAVARLKLAALQSAYGVFSASGSAVRRQDFEAYRRERGRALEYFTAFETLRGRYIGAWWQWPDGWQCADAAVERLQQDDPDALSFHAYLQWNAERQLAACRDVAKRLRLSIGLYLDTAIGVDAGGADAWMDRRAMLRGLSVGAPPDRFNPAGQDWGLTTYNPHGLVADAFGPFRQMLRAAMRYAGALRIDHVLGLMRLFVIPHGLGPGGGAYLRMPFAAMLAVVAEESRRWNCMFVGEDLGTVPENFRQALSSWGVWSYLVMLFERHGDGGFRMPDNYPALAVATFSTHDLPTFAGWISGSDLNMKRRIGTDPGESDDERWRSRDALLAALEASTGSRAGSFEDVVSFLAATPARLVSVAIEDVLGMAEQINIPGTVVQHPNWRRRWPLALEDFGGDERLRRIAAILAKAGRGSKTAVTRPDQC